jgi:tetrathionate reductase subunit B
MKSLLSILNNSASCGTSGCSTASCQKDRHCEQADSRRQFLQRASTIMLGSFSLTLLPMMPDAASDGQLAADPDSDHKQSTATPGSPGRTVPVLYGFLVDTDKCTGAGKCLTACRIENQVPDGYSRTWVERFVHFKDGTVQVDLVPESGYYGSGLPEIDGTLVDKAYFVPKLCNQCVEAPCNQVCPVHASFTSPEGVELVDPERCIGCGYCAEACPYGMRFINPETNNADKCTWCYHRITNNEQPACVEACPTGARVFGRLDDPDSELSRRLGTVRTHVLKEHLGTHPKLHYSGISGEVI